ncbi:33 kDa chaperonin [Anoxybacillus sp. BCO1]|nr:33 kDa chaperonin [Anoxybacillus sp. BCO1]
MTDYLVKALAYDGQVRAYAVRTTETVREAQRRHQTWPTASAALGRAMTAGVMMGAMLKGDSQITIKIEGGVRSDIFLSIATQKVKCAAMYQIRTCILS